jgi:predicted amidohydrolase
MNPSQKVLNGHPAVKVAIVQAAPVFFNREATIDKACATIAEAAGDGAQIIVFSEAWVSGYPYWGEGWESRVGDWMDVRGRFYDSTLLIDSDDTARLCAAAAKANAVVAIGCNEMDPPGGSHDLQHAAVHHNRGGSPAAISPTFVERAVWGCGDGSDLEVYDTDYGRIGGLICGENLMTLARAHLIGQGEDFHVAVFPGAFALHTGPKLEEFDASGDSFWGYSSCRAHAFEAGAFVLGSCGYITDADFPVDFALRDSLNIDYARGGSAIYAPIGIPLAPPTPGDTIVYAVCPAQFVKIAKAVIDTVGHYARPDLFTLSVHAQPYQQVVRRAVESTRPGELHRIADRHEVSVAELEAAVPAKEAA